jgi:hypothetical protein
MHGQQNTQDILFHGSEKSASLQYREFLDQSKNWHLFMKKVISVVIMNSKR